MSVLKEFPIHATVASSGLERSRKWYKEILGLEPDQNDAGGFWINFSGETWLHVYKTGSAGTAKNTIAGITVQNIESVMETLKSRGLKFEDYDMPGLKTQNGLATFESSKAAWFKDPDGNTFEISEVIG